MRLASSFLTLVFVSLVSLQARGSDWYVDAVNGSNANNGTSPATAWRTITHALSHTPAPGVQTIHIDAGTYNEALGESFPLQMQDEQQLAGVGEGSTHIQPSAPLSIGVRLNPAYGGTPDLSSLTVISDLSITAPRPVLIEGPYGECAPVLRNLELHGATGFAVQVFGDTTFAPPPSPLLERVRVSSNVGGLWITYGDVTAIDCVFTANSGQAVYLVTYSKTASASFTRCRMEGNGIGVQAEVHPDNHGLPGGRYTLGLFDSSISGNAGDGLRAMREFAYLYAHVVIERSTIANNFAAGVSTPSVAPDLRLRDSIVFGNGDDLALSAGAAVTNCDIGDGDFAGMNGNFAADPLFVSPAASDWRLRWASPCIDFAGLPATTSTLDLARNPRVTDGDLDTQEFRDLGAFEFAPLFRQGSGAIGTQLVLECWGEVGATTTVYFSRLPLATTPMSTAYGQFDLDPAHFGFFKSSAVGQITPVLVTRQIPNALALVGRTFSFQARTSSPAAPSGFAYTNPVQFTITP